MHAHAQQILFFKLLFNVKLIYSIQVLGPWLRGNRPFFSSVVGQRKGPSGANTPPVHGVKKCLESCSSYHTVLSSYQLTTTPIFHLFHSSFSMSRLGTYFNTQCHLLLSSCCSHCAVLSVCLCILLDLQNKTT